MQFNKHLYIFNYDQTEYALCQLESSTIFNEVEKHKLLFSNKKIEPSTSAFIKKRLDIILFSEDFTLLINKIKAEEIKVEGFKVEYIVLPSDAVVYDIRLEMLREIGYSIEGNTDYYNPNTTFALCHYAGIWYFGKLVKNNLAWQQHKDKPCSYSNSLSINIAKALINIATEADTEKKLLDVCCGVGTVMLEACFAHYNIAGCDISAKICRGARENIAHFNYAASVYCADIKDITQWYDVAIIDLPYNLFSPATEADILHIITSTAAITDRMVIVSIADISNTIGKVGFDMIAHCSVPKKGKTNFARRIWVCEKMK